MTTVRVRDINEPRRTDAEIIDDLYSRQLRRAETQLDDETIHALDGIGREPALPPLDDDIRRALAANLAARPEPVTYESEIANAIRRNRAGAIEDHDRPGQRMISDLSRKTGALIPPAPVIDEQGRVHQPPAPATRKGRP